MNTEITPTLPDPPVESAVRLPQFRRYWLARLSGSMAGQMEAVAVGWQVYDLTGRPLDLGLVGLCLFLPELLLALVTGHAADHFDRRTVLSVAICVDGLCVLALLALTLQGNRNVHWIFLVLVITGIARAFQAPASFSILPNLVSPRLYTNAATWISSAWQGANIMGPAIGGLLYTLGAAFVFATCASLFIVSATLVIGLKMITTQRRRGTVTWSSVLAGVHFIREHPLVLGAISLDLFAVLLGGATALLPVFARDILAVGPTGLGILRSAPAIGALVSAIILVHYPIQRNTGRILLLMVGVFGLATIGFGLSRSMGLSLILLTILGSADMVSVVVRRVLIQIATPDEMRGRVSAVESVFIGASNELGEFESGVTAALFGTVPAVVIGGLGTVLIVALWWRWFPALRKVDRLDSVSVAAAADH